MSDLAIKQSDLTFDNNLTLTRTDPSALSSMNAFLFIALLGAAAALPLAAYILIKERSGNLHKIWDLALGGHKLARVYVVIVGIAFLAALIGWAIAFSESKAQKRTSAATRQPVAAEGVLFGVVVRSCLVQECNASPDRDVA